MFNALILALGVNAVAAATPSPAPLPVVVIAAPNAQLHLEVARTESQREYGLMNRTKLAPHTGMIFTFSADGDLAFWMKDTLIPLDMIFIAPNGVVNKVYANVPVVPITLNDDRIPREVAHGKYVIELAAGEAAKDGIAEGVKLNVAAVPGGAP